MSRPPTAELPIIIFDFDGTIADTAPHLRGFLDNLMVKQGLRKVSKSELNNLRDYPLRQIVKDLNIGRLKLWGLVRSLKKEIRDVITEIDVVAGMPELLRELKDKGYTLGIVTSNDRKLVEQFIAQHNIEHFDFILGGNGPFVKDRALKSARKKFAEARQTCIYVGDETRDIDAARGADMPVIAVTWGFNSELALRQLEPDTIVNTPHEMAKYVAGL
jgi:phosphoglycolate phosphatase